MIFLIIVFAICAPFLLITFTSFRYWKKKGVKQDSILQLWNDNVKTLLQFLAPPVHLIKLYERFQNERYVGTCYFFSPFFFVRDLDLIKRVTVKDFENFSDRFQFVSSDVDPLWSKSLFLLRGDEWKAMRATISPTFTSSKLKGMFDLIKKCAENVTRFYENRPSAAESVNLKDAFAKYANDVIASAVFGVECHSLEDSSNEFYQMGLKASNLSGFWRNLSFIFMNIFPKLSKCLGVTLLPIEADKFFRKLVKTNIKLREENGIIRPDMIQLLIDAKKGKLKYEESRDLNTGFATVEESAIGREERLQHLSLTDEDIMGQALIFFFAGFDTTSTLMSFMAYELAVNPDIQERLQKEVDDTLHQCDGSVTYEALFKMKYLDMVVSETLRKWPNNAIIDRLCVKSYTIEPQKEGETPVYLTVGDLLWIPVYAIHRSSQYYPEPERFNPERFNNENRLNIRPYSYLPFGVGPRSCIGNRFALLETKILFFTLLSRFDIIVVEKTDIPLVLSKKQFNLGPSNGFWAGFRPRQQ